ncbi:MAG: hypothetical protein ACI4M6_07100 [Christensenellaceae bacterium]
MEENKMNKKAKILCGIAAGVLSLSMFLTGCNKTPIDPDDSTSDSSSVVSGEAWGGSTYLTYKNSAWTRLAAFYEDIKQNGLKSDPTKTGDLTYAAGTTLRMATGYNSKDTGITFSDNAKILTETNSAGAAAVTLADGIQYTAGSKKPTWVELEKRLNVKFEDKYSGQSAQKEFDSWKSRLNEVDMVSGTLSQLQQAGSENSLVNIGQYLNMMPNFKAYLETNKIVTLSITGSTIGDQAGAIYFSPYFDGVNDIERMPLMRVDFIEKLLDGEGEFTADESGKLAAAKYEPFMPTTGTIEVDVVKADGTATEKLTKNYNAYGNIVAKMNEALANGEVTGVQAVNMLRSYIDQTYVTTDNKPYYGTKRSDLFAGQNAAWDVDELVALLRCVVANSKTLNGTDKMFGIFSREEKNNQRNVDMISLAGVLFGVRGLESRSDYLYFDKDGNVHDARQEESTYIAMEKMHDLYLEGLISSDFTKDGVETKSETYLKNDNGFMSYDYNQTQTAYNYVGDLNANSALQEGEKYSAVMVPVSRWNDGVSEKYMRFTESWRSVKTDGWAISKAGIGDNQDKLYAALKLIDYAYSPEGQVLMSYGPDAFIKVKNAEATTITEKYETFTFNGEQWPVIADATFTELWQKASGNYTNYARQYLGSTLSFLKSQAFEYQCTTSVGKEGASKISTAIALNTINHPVLDVTENKWYTSIPTSFPHTSQENAIIDGLVNLSSSGKYSKSKGYSNLLTKLIVNGYGETGAGSREEVLSSVSRAQ